MNDNYIHIYNRKHMYPNEKPHLSARADNSEIVKLMDHIFSSLTAIKSLKKWNFIILMIRYFNEAVHLGINKLDMGA